MCKTEEQNSIWNHRKRLRIKQSRRVHYHLIMMRRKRSQKVSIFLVLLWNCWQVSALQCLNSGERARVEFVLGHRWVKFPYYCNVILKGLAPYCVQAKKVIIPPSAHAMMYHWAFHIKDPAINNSLCTLLQTAYVPNIGYHEHGWDSRLPFVWLSVVSSIDLFLREKLVWEHRQSGLAVYEQFHGSASIRQRTWPI